MMEDNQQKNSEAEDEPIYSQKQVDLIVFDMLSRNLKIEKKNLSVRTFYAAVVGSIFTPLIFMAVGPALNGFLTFLVSGFLTWLWYQATDNLIELIQSYLFKRELKKKGVIKDVDSSTNSNPGTSTANSWWVSLRNWFLGKQKGDDSD